MNVLTHDIVIIAQKPENVSTLMDPSIVVETDLEQMI